MRCFVLLLALVLPACSGPDVASEPVASEESGGSCVPDGDHLVLDSALVSALADQPDLLVHQAAFRSETVDGRPSLIVEAVRPQTLPHVLGLHAGDRLLQIDEIPLFSFAEVVSRLATEGEIELRFARDGEVRTLVVTLG